VLMTDPWVPRLAPGNAQALTSAAPIDPRTMRKLTAITGALDPLRTGKLSLKELQQSFAAEGLDLASPSVRVFGSLCLTENDRVDYTDYLTAAVNSTLQRRDSLATTSELHNFRPHPSVFKQPVDPTRQITVRRPDGTVYLCAVPAMSHGRQATNGRRKVVSHSICGVGSMVNPNLTFHHKPDQTNKAETVLKAYTGWENGEYGKTSMMSQLQQKNVWPTAKSTQLAEAGGGITFQRFLKALGSGPTTQDSMKAQHWHLTKPSWYMGSAAASSGGPHAASAGGTQPHPDMSPHRATRGPGVTSKRSSARSAVADFIDGQISAGELQEALDRVGVIVRRNGELDRLISNHSRVGGHTVRDFVKLINAMLPR